MKRGLLFALCFVILSGLASAQQVNHVIANSEDWKDTYSVMHYANLKGYGSDFLVSTKHPPLLLPGLSKGDRYRVISSSEIPYSLDMAGFMKSAGFANVEDLKVDSANLELINDLPDVKNFVVVSDSYGYNAIAAAPYAKANNAWVFLADRTNIDEIDAILSNRQIGELLIYGFTDREVRETLQKYNPKIIDTGDRFNDNVEIVKEYLKINPVKQVVLSNGEFIEREVMAGSNPVLFTGKQSVPPQIANYLKSSDIEVGVLIGSDLVGTATEIRRSTGISVIVKFARGSRVPSGAIAAVEGLDLFYVPVPVVALNIDSINYNRANRQLQVTYKSDSNIPVFFRGTITLKADDRQISRVGDTEAVFIGPSDFKTITYPDVELPDSGELTADVLTLFGDSSSSLERILEGTFKIGEVNIIDGCEIGIKQARYSKPKSSFVIYIENVGPVDCFVDVELEKVFVDRAERTLGSEGATFVPIGKTRKVLVVQDMSDEDLARNKFVNVAAYYGERENSLIKLLKGRFELNVDSVSLAMMGLGLLILIIIAALVILLIVFFRRRKDEDW